MRNRFDRNRASQSEGIGTEQYLYRQRHLAWKRILIALCFVVIAVVVAIAIQGILHGHAPIKQGRLDYYHVTHLHTKRFTISDLNR